MELLKCSGSQVICPLLVFSVNSNDIGFFFFSCRLFLPLGIRDWNSLELREEARYSYR